MRTTGPNSPDAASDPERFDSWKEIAAFFRRDVRTVRRWEAERNLPVHRLPGGERSGVYAYASELREWLRNAGQSTPDLNAPADAGGDPSPGDVRMQPAAIDLDAGSALHPADAGGAATATAIATETGIGREIDEQENAARLAPGPTAPVQEPTAPVQEPTAPVQEPTAAPGPTRPRSRLRWVALASILLLVLTGLGALTYSRMHAAVRSPDTNSPAHPSSSEAHDLYLRGRYFFESRSEANLLRAVDLFTQSIVQDPQYAPAYAGLADSYLLLREYGHMPESEAFTRASAAAQRATALDPDLPEGHRALAFVLRYWNWDMAAADREFQRALALNPNDSQTHHWYATSLFCADRPQEALREIDLARSLQPQSISVLADRGLILDKIDTEASKKALEETEAAAPDFPSTQVYLSEVSLQLGQYGAFLEHGRRNAQLIGNQLLEKAFAHAQNTFAAQGAPAMLAELGKAVAALADEHNVTASYATAIFAAAHDRDATLHYLHLAYDRHDSSFVGIGNDPHLEFLKDDPDFIALAAKSDVSTAPRQ